MSSQITGGGNLSDHETSNINRDESADPVHSAVEHRAGNMSDVCDDCGIVLIILMHYNNMSREGDLRMTATMK